MEPLSDPLTDRKIADVKPPPHKPLQMDRMYPDKGNCPPNPPQMPLMCRICP